MRFGMVIDLQRCVGCSACALACKAEHNTRDRADDVAYNWADFIIKTEGTFPNVTHNVIPVLCNHCSNAPCVEACPVTPNKAMYKTPEGITMHDPALCIGCGKCLVACPYSNASLDDTSLNGEQYSVISFNFKDEDPQPRWSDKTAIIPGVTASGAEVAKRAGVTVPAGNLYASQDVQPLRKAGVVEKCNFCAHRTLNGMQPACVDACPSQARIFGDQDNPKSTIAQVLAKDRGFRLQEDKGTKPNVHYIGKYSPRA